MKYTSVKFCFLFNFCKKNCKVDFFTSKYAKNCRFHAFFSRMSARTYKIAALSISQCAQNQQNRSFLGMNRKDLSVTPEN